MLADNGICCIDEFETMNEKDQVAIHEAMEQQTITLSKAGIQATLNARASILASVLPKATYYDPTQPLHRNCMLSPPIMSRFDLMFVMQDVHDDVDDDKVAKHILAMHGGHEEEAATLSKLELQQYIAMCRMFKPRFTPEARDRAVRCYKKLRADRTYVRGSSGVTVRQLESLVRLSEAIARVYLDEKIRDEYVKEAFELQKNTLKNAAESKIDLEEEAPPEPDVQAAQAEGGEGGAAAGEAAQQQRTLRRKKITFQEYQRIGQMLARRLENCDRQNLEVTEADLVAWYMEQVQDDIQDEAQGLEQMNLVQLIINRMIDRDRVIIVYRHSDDPLRPEFRVLAKHPNFVIGEDLESMPAGREQP
jgi:DNA replication licensing factor MCM6